VRAIVRVVVWLAAVAAACPAAAADRPNIVWIVVDDMSADFGCYGSSAAPTPSVDRLAAEGTRFAHAFVTAPVCSPCRSAMITGMYQTTIGAHHHRSGRGTEKIRLPDWLYIRNFHPGRPLLQPNAYKDAKPTLIALRALQAAGRLDPVSERLLFAPARPPEELYRWREDRWQLKNLAADPARADMLAVLRGRLDRWMAESADQGPEPDAMYESDMKVYGGDGSPDVEANIATMKRWAAEGK